MASVLIGNSCQTQTLQGLGRMGVKGSKSYWVDGGFHSHGGSPKMLGLQWKIHL